MRVLIATAQVPFVRGGAESLAEGLRQALQGHGHEADVVAIPFKWYPAERIVDQMLACRLLDVSEVAGAAVDRVIGLRFPAYLIPHPRKVLWLLHQHRDAYDLWAQPGGDLHEQANGATVRAAIHEADRRLLPEARAIFTIAGNVSRRLRKYTGLGSQPLYHPPPHAEKLHAAPAEDFFFYPSRLGAMKRQTLVLEALTHTREPVRVRLAGTGDNPGTQAEYEALARKLGVHRRVEWLGRVSEERKRDEYARCLAVVFPPRDEDYGYVTLEGMLSSRAVVTCTDSGGPLEFVTPEQTGLVSEPTPEALAAALDRLWADRALARRLGEAGREAYDALGIGWPHVVERLVA